MAHRYRLTSREATATPSPFRTSAGIAATGGPSNMYDCCFLHHSELAHHRMQAIPYNRDYSLAETPYLMPDAIGNTPY